ncbi:MAG: hypothetical protein JRN35_06120 [Nitrososphaerota archaeon]|nr:hypothetical protein [Nitrososphaerota archaeon]
MAKVYFRQDNIGTAKYTVSYHNGVKKHRDGSPFFDIAIFRNKKKLDAFVRKLRVEGYKEKRM